MKKLILVALTITILQGCRKEEPIVNIPPTISGQTFTSAEDIGDAEVIGTVVAEDKDTKDVLSFSIDTDTSGLFEISSGGELSLKTGSSLDFETATSHSLIVSVSDGKDKASATITVTVTDVNEAPSTSDQQFTAAEDIDAATAIGTVAATDMDAGATISFSIEEDPSELFEIESSTGILSLAAGKSLDFETEESHTLSVQVSDGTLNSTSSVEITVEDINEAPSIADQSFTVGENSSTIGTIEAEDPDAASTLTYTIITNDGNLFEINSSTGVLATATGQTLNFENKTSHSLTIQVTDGEFTKTAAISITVTDENDAPVVANQSFSASEDIDDVAVIGTVISSDEDAGSTLTYSISVNDNNLFEIDSNTGELSLVANKYMNFENKETHNIEVSVSDGTATTKGTITIDVTNVIDVNVITLNSSLPGPNGMAIDANDNIYVSSSNSIKKINLSGVVEATYDGFSTPAGIAIDASGNLYITNVGDHTVVKLDASGNITTLAGVAGTNGFTDGAAATALFKWPIAIALGTSNDLYILDAGNHAVRRLDMTTNMVTTIAGNGTSGYVDGIGAAARFHNPQDIIADGNGNYYIADLNHTIRKLNASTGEVTTIAGNGTQGTEDGNGTAARFFQPLSVEIDAAGNLIVGDTFNHTMRKIDSSGNVSTLAGSPGVSGDVDGQGDYIRFRNPAKARVASDGSIYICDLANAKLKKMEIK